jgi:CO/xanthine dehydrogenase Mo-binding subunit
MNFEIARKNLHRPVGSAPAGVGARRIDEIGIVGAPAAVANAFFLATGSRVRDLPMAPDKLI